MNRTPRKYSLQWWVQAVFYTTTGSLVVVLLYLPESLIGPVS